MSIWQCVTSSPFWHVCCLPWCWSTAQSFLHPRKWASRKQPRNLGHSLRCPEQLSTFSLCLSSFQRSGLTEATLLLFFLTRSLRTLSLSSMSIYKQYLYWLGHQGQTQKALLHVLLIQVSFCGDITIHHYFCEFTSVWKMSCSDT